jgi:hypothetical protein
MPTTQRIFLASVIAPLVVALPAFVSGYAMWAGFPFTRNAPLASVSPLEFAIVGVLPIYIGLVLLCAIVALLLRQLGVLRRSMLLLIGGGISLAVGTWLACDWGRTCSPIDGATNFAIQACICFTLAAVLSVSWWWLANRGSAS